MRFIKYDVLILKLSGLKYVHSLSDRLLVVCTNLLTVLISSTNFAVLWKKSRWLTEKNVVIAGDLNAGQLSPNCNSSMLKLVFQAFNFRDLITRPTRIAESSSTRLDLILTNNFPKIFTSGVLDYSIADHKFVFAVFMLKKQNERPILNKVYSYRKERLPSSKTLSLSGRLCVMPLANTGPAKSEP